MADIVETSEARWFKIVVFVVSGFFVGFSLANIIYFNRIRRNNGAPGVTRGEATAMLWINAILFGISLIIFIWSIYRLVAGQEYRRRVTEYFQESPEGIVEASPVGVPVPRLRRSRTVVQETTTAPMTRRAPVRETTTTEVTTPVRTTTTRTVAKRALPGGTTTSTTTTTVPAGRRQPRTSIRPPY